MPFSESDAVNEPVSLYAATKRSNELIAQVYARLYGVPSTGLRFFTVYGPWGRPDMAPMLFTEAILAGRPIRVFNRGDMARDFTYVDDIVEGIVRLLDKAPAGDIPTDLYNIGCGSPMQLMDFIRTLESALGRKAELDLQPMQPGRRASYLCRYAETAAGRGLQPADHAPRGHRTFRRMVPVARKSLTKYDLLSHVTSQTSVDSVAGVGRGLHRP